MLQEMLLGRLGEVEIRAGLTLPRLEHRESAAGADARTVLEACNPRASPSSAPLSGRALKDCRPTGEG
jgi:hypothetical protein